MTVEIPLTKGFVAVVDDEDAPLVARHKWRALVHRNTVYAARTLPWINGRRPCELMHRLIMKASDRRTYVDHIDGNGLNNTRGNLRLATPSQNMQNSRHRARTIADLKGVAFNPKLKKFYAQICKNGKRTYLGSFPSAFEAHQAYKNASARLFGEFSNSENV